MSRKTLETLGFLSIAEALSHGDRVVAATTMAVEGNGAGRIRIK